MLAPQKGPTRSRKRPLTRPDGSGRPLPAGKAVGVFGALRECARKIQQVLRGVRSEARLAGARRVEKALRMLRFLPDFSRNLSGWIFVGGRKIKATGENSAG